MFKSKQELLTHRNFLKKYFEKPPSRLEKTKKSIQKFASSLYSYIKKPFNYFNTLNYHQQSQIIKKQHKKAIQKPPKHERVLEKRKSKIKKFTEDQQLSENQEPQQKPVKKVFKQSQASEANHTDENYRESAEFQNNSSSRRKGFDSFLIERPPSFQLPRNKLKNPRALEQENKWLDFTKKAVSQFKSFRHEQSQENQQGGEKDNSSSKLEDFRRKRKLPRERTDSIAKDYQQYVKQKLKKANFKEKTINFLNTESQKEKKRIQENKKQEQQKQKLLQSEKNQEEKSVLPNPFSSGITIGAEASKQKQVSQKPSIFGQNTFKKEEGSLFQGFNFSQNSMFNKDSQKNPESQSKPLISFMNSSNSIKNKDQSKQESKPSLFSFMNNSNNQGLLSKEKKANQEQKKDQQKESKDQKVENSQTDNNLKEKLQKKQSAKEEKVNESVLISKFPIQSKKQDEKKEQVKSDQPFNPFLSTSPAKKVDLNEVLQNSSSQGDNKIPFSLFMNKKQSIPGESAKKQPFISTPLRNNIFQGTQNEKQNSGAPEFKNTQQDNSMEIQNDEPKKHQSLNPSFNFSHPTANLPLSDPTQNRPNQFQNKNQMNNNFSFSPSNSSIYNIQPTFQQQNQMSFLPPGADPQQNHALAQELFAQKNEPSLFAENRMDSQNNKKRRDKGSARIS